MVRRLLSTVANLFSTFANINERIIYRPPFYEKRSNRDQFTLTVLGLLCARRLVPRTQRKTKFLTLQKN